MALFLEFRPDRVYATGVIEPGYMLAQRPNAMSAPLSIPNPRMTSVAATTPSQNSMVASTPAPVAGPQAVRVSRVFPLGVVPTTPAAAVGIAAMPANVRMMMLAPGVVQNALAIRAKLTRGLGRCC